MNRKQWQMWTVRIAFFIVFFWFGITKVLGASPASQLVLDLLAVTLPFFPSHEFLIFFGTIEVFIGVGFLFPKFTKIAIVSTFIHLCITFLPIVLLPHHTWISFGVLSTEGQYIAKNLILFAALWGLWIDYQDKIQ
ncbi:hypothetical protein IT418_01475 [bacterium]|nr:hypothetical protein [bacterium]